MDCLPYVGLAAVLSVVAGAAASYFFLRRQDRLNLDSADARAKQLVSQAEKNAENILKEAELKAKDEIFHKREEFNRETEQCRTEQRDQERRLEKKEDALEQKHQHLLKKEKPAPAHRTQAARTPRAPRQEARRRPKRSSRSRPQKLHEITGLSREEAEKLLLERARPASWPTRSLAASRSTRSSSRPISEEKARRILATAIQRYAAEHTADTTVSTVDIPNDDMKGRIIGREGRNIRTFEKATGVDVIVDDTPGVVIVSAFDNIRREIARLALTKLIQDGRIHPTRIEEVVDGNAGGDGEAHPGGRQGRPCMEAERRPAAREAGAPAGPAASSAPATARTCCSTASRWPTCAGMMADELGLDGQLARRCGLLHDIGKAADHEMEGGHPEDRRRAGQALRRDEHGGAARHRRPSRRRDDRPHLHGAGRRRRRHQRRPARRPPRDAGEVRQAAGGAGSDRLAASPASSRPTPSRPAASCA